MNRRDFVALASAGAAFSFACDLRRTTAPRPVRSSGQQQGVVLFQGDSITDAGRIRPDAQSNDPQALGQGYALLLAAALLRDRAGEGLLVYNRGTSGDRIGDLKSRWDTDTIALKPTILSIGVGINDALHDRDSGRSATDFEADYLALVQTTQSDLPGVRIILLEPFLLLTGSVVPDWFGLLDPYRSAVARVAKAAGATLVLLQERFTLLAQQSSPQNWSADGVHPTLAGHAEIATAWRDTAEW